MARSRGEGGGLGLAARFALTTFAALAVVAGLGAGALYVLARDLSTRHERELIEQALAATADANAEGVAERASTFARSEGGVERGRVRLQDGREAIEYRLGSGERAARVVVPVPERRLVDDLSGAIAAVTALIVAAASVAAWVLASRVARPLRTIVDEVRTLSHGGHATLRYRARVKGGGEVAQLSRALDRMSEELAAAHEAELELGLRERELELAEQVREALLPMATPMVDGYDLGGLHLPGAELSGVFHDFLEHDGGRVGLLVCEVAGEGVPAAIVGAIARTYLRAALADGSDPGAAFARVNRDLGRDLRRGIVVTALYALLDPAGGRATVACAGHRLPLVRTSAADGRVRVFQPEGVALGLDPGPVFERTLAVQDLEVAPGDRLVLATSGAVTARDAAGAELGERGFFSLVHRCASRPTGEFLRLVRRELDARRDADEPRRDAVSLVTVRRDPASVE